VAGAESYPEDLRYHPEHDWAPIEGDEAVLGITWWAQDALGELVHFEAPSVGGTVTKDEAYGEVESVKAVSDVNRPALGEILEVNERAVEEPEDDQRRPVRRGVARPDPDERPGPRSARCSTSRPIGRSWPSNDGRLPLAHRSRTARRCSRRSRLLDRRAVRADSRGGTARPRARRPAGPDGVSARAAPGGARREERPLGGRALVPRRRHLRPTMCPPSWTRSSSAASPDRVHAVPARDEQGVLQAIFEYQTAICELDGHGRVERLRV